MTTEKERIESIRVNYEKTAKAMKEAGWTITEDVCGDILWVENTDENSIHEFKYDEKDRLLNDKPDWLEMDVFDYILAIAASW